MTAQEAAVVEIHRRVEEAFADVIFAPQSKEEMLRAVAECFADAHGIERRYVTAFQTPKMEADGHIGLSVASDITRIVFPLGPPTGGEGAP